MIKTIIFDLDDTLYNERDFVYGAFREVCMYLSQNFNKNCEKLYKDSIEILNVYGRGKIFNKLCDKYSIDEDIHKLVNVYRNAKPQLQLYEDALYVLKKFNSCDEEKKISKYKLGLITDGNAKVQRNKVESLNLDKYIHKIIITDDYGLSFWKPNEFSYREMMKCFNCKAEECVYVGDNPNKDFIGARKVGMYTVRILRETGDHMNTFLDKEYEADFSIKSLKELDNIINNL